MMPTRPLRTAPVLLLSCVLALHPLHAQRERLAVRLDGFAGTTLSAPAGTRVPADATQRGIFLSDAHRLLRDDGNTMILVGAQYRGMQVTLPSRLSDSPANATALHVATADLWLLRTLNDRHTLVTVLRPGVYGDLDDVGAQLRVEGAVFVDRILSPKATVGVGLSYASSFGRVLPIPVVHVVARPRRQILVDALLPARADVWWLPRKGLDIGFNAALSGAQYGLADANQVVPGSNALWLANATAGPQVRWAPSGGKVQFTADAGLTVLRRLRYARNGDELADLDPGNVPYARLGVQWLF